MKCNYCGADNKEEAKFCASCGAELTARNEEAEKEETKIERVEVKEKKEPVKMNTTKDGKATASLVLGICSLIIWCLSLPLSLIGLILGIASKERSGKRTAGIVINTICLIISTLCAIAIFMFGTAVNSAITEYNRSGSIDNFFEALEKEIERAEKASEDYSQSIESYKENTTLFGDNFY